MLMIKGFQKKVASQKNKFRAFGEKWRGILGKDAKNDWDGENYGPWEGVASTCYVWNNILDINLNL